MSLFNRKSKPLKIYIAGPVTGVPNYKDAFYKGVVEVEQMLCYIDRPFVIITPLDICEDDWSWGKSMFFCIKTLLGCNMVYFLRNWEKSKGASIEHKISKFLLKPIVYQPARHE